uniref:histidine-rich glycoprotein-like n=1 Tax=Myodes glareolus TaxID=447135 RepID=UPI002020201B|nr:histidine-rich glycoprotein-like [Myodes glareolus]
MMANREDEIRLRRYLEAANTEEEYDGENDIHRRGSRERTLIHRYLQERGFRSGDRGRNMNFFGQRLSENQPPLHLMRYDNREVQSRWTRIQSEERHPQIERNQVSFGRFHGHSLSRAHHISRSHGYPSRRSYSHFRSTPVNSDRPHHDRSVRPHREHSEGRRHDHSGRHYHDHSGRHYHDHSGRPHHDHSGRHYRDHSGRPHHDHSDRPHHDHSGRFHLGHTGRAHPSHSGIAHQHHAERAQLSRTGLAHRDHRGRAHLNYTRPAPYNRAGRAYGRHVELAHRGHRVGAYPNHTGLAHHNHAGRVNHDHSGRAHNNRTWRSRSHEERYRGQRGRFERSETSSDSDSEMDRFSTIIDMTEYLRDQEQQRNELINLNREMVEEGYRSSAESEESSDSLWRYEVGAEFLNGRYTSIRTIPRHPKGVRLNFNVGAWTNQTNLSLHTRFTIVRNLRRARMNNMNLGLRRDDD